MPETFEEYTILDGKANIKPKTKTWEFCSLIPPFFKNYESINHKIASTSKVLVGQFEALKTTIDELSSYFDELGNLYRDADQDMQVRS